MKKLAINKRARFDYEILEQIEAGIVLLGHEVKSVKAGNLSLKGAYVVLNTTGPNNSLEPWLLNSRISKYPPAGELPDYDPERSRKLLLSKAQIKYFIGKKQESGLTIVPLSVYSKRNKIKVEIGLGRGKKTRDKRDSIKKRESDRNLRRLLKNRR